MWLGGAQHCLLLRFCSVLRRLVRSRRDDCDSTGAAHTKLVHNLWPGFRWRANEREIGSLRQPADVSVRVNTGDRFAFRIDGKYRPAESSREQIAHHRAAHALGTIGCADHCDRSWLKQEIEVAHGHGNCLVDFANRPM